jgi:hypothetical protein
MLPAGLTRVIFLDGLVKKCSFSIGTWLALFRGMNPTSVPPSFDSMPQRHEAGDLFVAAKLGDIVLVRRLMAKAMQVGFAFH